MRLCGGDFGFSRRRVSRGMRARILDNRNLAPVWTDLGALQCRATRAGCQARPKTRQKAVSRMPARQAAPSKGGSVLRALLGRHLAAAKAQHVLAIQTVLMACFADTLALETPGTKETCFFQQSQRLERFVKSLSRSCLLRRTPSNQSNCIS